ncbi:hypothetical protein SAMN05660909_00059 [Chitinophaga terrae (ex Kim and Jung 2007)]|jgi:hypothetical protein|uniref:Uncharacterized protein n=1 Tax=Chitinophaga terrae (ex Kim and Jung 2007) TaxID=408074 RepID=A0A1H3WVX2_9BACT|nr:hypothetical protein [Chitinophaga terrae (ex Kim and Jung 2007)]MDQ0107084.1 hypothetical protein [Chitinophaga terrae (ex Kim and Jung 2007)]SDZ90318.1 hypothetical protein SAMN05660909_00059 [Chitinophaga terrae (ex Kim and Jung 2007)]
MRQKSRQVSNFNVLLQFEGTQRQLEPPKKYISTAAGAIRQTGKTDMFEKHNDKTMKN